MRLIKVSEDIWRYRDIEGSFEYVIKTILKNKLK